jgi:hypothetical protein
MRLIDGDALERRADEVTFMGFQAVERKKHFMDLVSAMAKSCPTIDSVPVVRCKDCDFRDELYSGDLILCRRKMSGIVKDTDFCSYGKRKVTADED